jgi:hypothetical protein
VVSYWHGIGCSVNMPHTESLVGGLSWRTWYISERQSEVSEGNAGGDETIEEADEGFFRQHILSLLQGK